jgi:hypothetical protein
MSFDYRPPLGFKKHDFYAISLSCRRFGWSCVLQMIYEIGKKLYLPAMTASDHRFSFLDRKSRFIVVSCFGTYVLLYGRAAGPMGKERDRFANGKFREEFLLKQTSPGVIQELTAFGAEKSPWIKKNLLCMVFDMDHAFSYNLVHYVTFLYRNGGRKAI